MPEVQQPGDQEIEDAGRDGAWHALLLRLAGAVPDDLLSEVRVWLAEGQRADVAQALAFAALTGRIPVTEADAALFSAALIADGQDTGPLADLEILDETEFRPLPWTFAPLRIDRAQDADRSPMLLDLTADPVALAELDRIDQAAVAAVAPAGATGLWRAWRIPADGSPWPAPRRVFVVGLPARNDGDLIDDEQPGAEAVQLTARIQEALLAAGEPAPQVEVCPEDLPIPPYQGTACAHAALLWAAEPAVPIQLARVFDAVDAETGPSFDLDHPRIDDPDELERLLDYLDSALPVLSSSSTMPDVLAPDRPALVPLTFRTDGVWIWTDTVSYYLEQHAIAPDPGLLAHLRAAGPLPAPVSEVALHRVLSFLQRPDDAEAVWVVPELDTDDAGYPGYTGYTEDVEDVGFTENFEDAEDFEFPGNVEDAEDFEFPGNVEDAEHRVAQI